MFNYNPRTPQVIFRLKYWSRAVQLLFIYYFLIYKLIKWGELPRQSALTTLLSIICHSSQEYFSGTKILGVHCWISKGLPSSYTYIDFVLVHDLLTPRSPRRTTGWRL